MMELKKEWFEPGPDGKVPFVCKWSKAHGGFATRISAAFRALLAEDEAQETPALQVGDVVRLDDPAQMCCEQFIGVQATITGFREDGNPYYTSSRGDSWWPLSACTLVRRAGEAAPVDAAGLIHDRKMAEEQVEQLQAKYSAQLDYIRNLQSGINTRDAAINRLNDEIPARNDEIVRLRAEVERLKSECSEQQRYVLDLESAIARKETRIKVLEVANDSLTQYSSNLTAKRDALQARIDAGVRVWGTDDSSCPVTDWLHIRMDGATRTALIIDAHPIDQPDAAMVDERTGKADRREVGCDASLEARLAIGRDHTRVYVDDLDCNGTVKCARSNDRRRTTGTIADRDKP